MLWQRLLEEPTLSRTILSAPCFILGSALLMPASLRLWKFLAVRLAPPEVLYLPDPHTNYVLFLNSREVGEMTALVIATTVGIALLLVGLRIARWRRV
jgi:hypothetical protein